MADYIASTKDNDKILRQIAQENGITTKGKSTKTVTKELKALDPTKGSNSYGTTIGNATLKDLGYTVSKDGKISKTVVNAVNNDSTPTVTTPEPQVAYTMEEQYQRRNFRTGRYMR